MSSLIPIGYHFAPLDTEILTYLVHNLTGGVDDVIIHADVFGVEPPWELFKRCCSNVGVDKNAYFFSVVTKKGKIGLKNFNRAVGKFGTWKGDNKGTDIADPKDKRVVLGTKRKFSFKTEDNYDKSCKWLMTEYSLAGEYKKIYACGSDHHEYVICKIKKKIDNRKCREQVGCSASSTNDLEHKEINLESAQEQSCSTFYINSAANYQNSVLAADSSQGIECSIDNISNLEQLRRFMNEADDDMFDSVLDNEVNYDEMMNLDIEEVRDEILAMGESQEQQQAADPQSKNNETEDEDYFKEIDDLLEMNEEDVTESREQQEVADSQSENEDEDNFEEIDDPLEMIEEDVDESQEQKEAADLQSENEDEDNFDEIDDPLEMIEEDVDESQEQKEAADLQSENEAEDNLRK